MEKLRLPARVVHLVSTGFLAGSVILNYFFNTNAYLADDSQYAELALPLCSVLSFASGLANVYLLKPPTEQATISKAAKNKKKEAEEVDEKERELLEHKQNVQSVWGDLNKFKIAVALLLTPLADPLVMMVLKYTANEEERASYIDENDMMKQKGGEAREIKIQVQFWAIVALILISLISKAYREEVCNGFIDDPINNKLEEITQRFQMHKLAEQQQQQSKSKPSATSDQPEQDQDADEGEEDYGEEQKRDMMQAVKDLRNLYGQEIDSDDNLVQKSQAQKERPDDSDSEGVEVLQKQSRAFEGNDESEESMLKENARFKSYVPKRDGCQPTQSKYGRPAAAKQTQPQQQSQQAAAATAPSQKPLFQSKYDPRQLLDEAARKRVQDMIAASREAQEDQLRKEGKTPQNTGIFAKKEASSAKAKKTMKEMYGRSKREDEYEEVMDHLEEPELSEEELLDIGKQLKERLRTAQLARLTQMQGDAS